MLHSRVEPNSKMVSNAVLPPCQSRTEIMNLVRHDISTAFETGLTFLSSLKLSLTLVTSTGSLRVTFANLAQSILPWVPEDMFFLIDISRRSRVNEAQSAEEKKITSGHRSTQPHFHARSQFRN